MSESVVPPLAAIDVGTNSIRLVVAQPERDGIYRVLDEEREMTRLGEGLARTGRLADPNMELSFEAIGRMKAIADGANVTELRAVATSALREAKNGGYFKREVWRRHRVRLEVISADEEAQFAFASAIRRFNLEGRSVAVADLGGGSLEVVLSAGEVVDQVHSLQLGTVRLTERFARSDPMKRRHWRRLRGAIDKAIQDEIGEPPFTVEVMIGSGGTFSALGGMVRFEHEGKEGTPHGHSITRAEITRWLARLLEIPVTGRRRISSLPPQRADIIVAGTAVIARLAKHLACRQIIVNDGGVRDGVLLGMIADRGLAMDVPSAPPERMDRVRRFAKKCRANERHGEHVARLAGRLFDGLPRRYQLPATGREILIAAALLHEIGFLINHAKHHKHAYHLIMHSDLAGFSSREIELIANVVRYHRRAFPKKSHENFRRLDAADQRLVSWLAAVLRIATALNRSHRQLVQDIRMRTRGDRIRMILVSSEEPSVELWDARRKVGLFEDAFKTRLTLGWEQADAKP